MINFDISCYMLQLMYRILDDPHLPRFICEHNLTQKHRRITQTQRCKTKSIDPDKRVIDTYTNKKHLHKKRAENTH